MRRKLALLLLALLTVPIISGCWNKMELEEGAYVLAVGIDRGERFPYRFTALIPRPASLAGKEEGGGGKGGGGKDEKPFVLATLEAPSLSSAVSLWNAFIGRRVALDHTRAIFLHEELARQGGLNLLDELVRFRQARETIFVVVTRERGEAFMAGLKPELDKNPIRYIEQLTYQQWRNATLPAEGQLKALVARLDVAYAQPIAYYAALVADEEERPAPSPGDEGFKAGELPRRGGSSVEMIGAAAFRGDRMVGVLTGEEVRSMLMLQDRFRMAYIAFQDPKDPDRYVSVHLYRSRPLNLNVDLSGERPRLSARITLEAEVLGIQSGVDYSQPALQAVLEEAMARQIEEQIRSLVRKTQEWETDVIGFGRHAVRQFPTVAAWEAYDWPGRYPEAEFDVAVSVTLRRFGLTMKPVK